MGRANNTNIQVVSFPEAPVDGTQYARKDAGWEAVAGGGGDYQNYTKNIWVDALSTANWVYDTGTWEKRKQGFKL